MSAETIEQPVEVGPTDAEMEEMLAEGAIPCEISESHRFSVRWRRCEAEAAWRVRTRCRDGHEVTFAICDEHHRLTARSRHTLCSPCEERGLLREWVVLWEVRL